MWSHDVIRSALYLSSDLKMGLSIFIIHFPFSNVLYSGPETPQGAMRIIGMEPCYVLGVDKNVGTSLASTQSIFLLKSEL